LKPCRWRSPREVDLVVGPGRPTYFSSSVGGSAIRKNVDATGDFYRRAPMRGNFFRLFSSARKAQLADSARWGEALASIPMYGRRRPSLSDRQFLAIVIATSLDVN
jgi:hypothetical protein